MLKKAKRIYERLKNRVRLEILLIWVKVRIRIEAWKVFFQQLKNNWMM